MNVNSVSKFRLNKSNLLGKGMRMLFVLALAACLADTTLAFGFFALFLLAVLFMMLTKLHFTEDSLALHFLFKNTHSLIHIVIAYIYANHITIHPFQGSLKFIQVRTFYPVKRSICKQKLGI